MSGEARSYLVAHYSLLGNDLVLAALERHISAEVPLSTRRVAEFLKRVDSLAHWERSSIVRFQLLPRDAEGGIVKTGVALVEPRALDIRLALRVVHLIVLLTGQFREALDLLLIEGADLSTAAVRLLAGKASLSGAGICSIGRPKVVPLLRCKVALTMVAGMIHDDGAKALLCALYGPVLQR